MTAGDARTDAAGRQEPRCSACGGLIEPRDPWCCPASGRRCAAAPASRQEQDEYVKSGWSIHPTPDGRRLMMPHDKNSVHMDGCIPLYVRRDHMEARGIVLDSMEPAARGSEDA